MILKKLALTLALAASVAASAQSFKTGYFLDNYTYAYRLNAAAPLESKDFTFFALGLGNASLDLNSNFGITSILAFEGGKLVLPVFNDVFSEAQAISGLLRNNYAELATSGNVITIGRQSGFNRFSLEFNVRSDVYLNMPMDVFALLKRGLESLATQDYEPNYNFVGMHFGMNSYSELALGYSRQIGDAVTLGARLKGLFGRGSSAFDWALSVGAGPGNTIIADTDASICVSSPVDLKIPTILIDHQEYYYLGGLLTESVAGMIGGWGRLPRRRIAGFGAAADLGITVKPIDGLTLTASVNDLGFLTWKSTINGRMRFNDQIDRKDYSRIFAIDNSGGPTFTTFLNYTVHAGARYRMPFYDRLSLGLLGTFRQHSAEGRIGLDITPLDFISITGSAGLGTYGGSVGAAVNFRIPLVNFFVGIDGMLFNFIPGTVIPAGGVNTAACAGLVLAI